MTKGVAVGRRHLRSVLKSGNDTLPFPRPPLEKPEDFRQRQLADILAGLNHLRAPMVFRLHNPMFGFPSKCVYENLDSPLIVVDLT